MAQYGAIVRMDPKITEKFVLELINSIGENPSRDGLRETPQRVARMYNELLSGYKSDPVEVFKVFKSNGYKGLVTVSNNFYSLCEHHLLPFFGRIYIGYVPNGKILGISKFARLINIFAKRLQTQEYLTEQIAKSLEQNLHPKGLVVHVHAKHLCMSMRGIKSNGVTKTTVHRGVLQKRKDLLDQFFRDVSSESRMDINYGNN